MAIPIYVENSWFVLVMYGTIVAAVLGAAAFVWLYFKRHMSKVSSRVDQVEERVDDIEGPWPEADEIRERVIHIEGYLHHMSRGLESEMSHLKDHVLSESEKSVKNLRKDVLSKLTDGLTRNEMKISRLGAKVGELGKGIKDEEKARRKASKDTKKQLREMVRMHLFMMTEELKNADDEDVLSSKLANIRTLRSFARKQKLWDKKMQEDLVKSMQEMEKDAAGLSPLYSMFIDEIRKN